MRHFIRHASSNSRENRSTSLRRYTNGSIWRNHSILLNNATAACETHGRTSVSVSELLSRKVLKLRAPAGVLRICGRCFLKRGHNLLILSTQNPNLKKFAHGLPFNLFSPSAPRALRPISWVIAGRFVNVRLHVRTKLQYVNCEKGNRIDGRSAERNRNKNKKSRVVLSEAIH
jgi:hypothetical protein